MTERPEAMTKSPKELAAELRALEAQRQNAGVHGGYVVSRMGALVADHHATIIAALEDAGEVEGLRKALQPFADACAKADASSEEVRRAGMGNGHSDEATPGWGIRYKHLKEARRALGSAK